MSDSPNNALLQLTSMIVSAFVSNNSVPTGSVPTLLSDVHASLERLANSGQEPASVPEPLVPAVPIKKSITDDYIVCLEDGKKFKSLKRHLAMLGLTPDGYRAKWGLPASYPMVAPGYSAARSSLAKNMGLGNARKKVVESAPAPAVEAKKKPVGRPRKQAA